jgi:hypothetical protein
MRTTAMTLLCFGLVASGCKRNSATGTNTEPTAPIVACNILTKEDVGSIQGATITDATPGEGAAGELFATQCYYASSEPNKSVSVSILQKNLNGGVTAEEFWKDTFVEQKKKEAEGEEERRRIPPVKVNGLGADAYWAPSGIGGTLYVLNKNKNALLRISLGGPDSLDTKLEKSKKLAAKALERL